MRLGLIVIDMQKRFLDSGRAMYPDFVEALEIINYVADEFRANKLPVIWVQDREDIVESDPGFAVLDELRVAPGDSRVTKEAANSFCEPGLADALAEQKVDFALLCGFKAEGCVLATARGAADRGMDHALLRGAVISPASDAPGFVERISPIMSWEVAVALARDCP